MAAASAREPWALVLDESFFGDVLTVGGFMARQDILSEIADSWRRLKSEVFEIDAGSELKFTMQPDHPTRVALDAQGWKHRDRIPEMLTHIGKMDIIVVADTIIDMRGEDAPQDYYIDALQWCIRRLANHLQFCLRRPRGPHSVLIDYPPSPADFSRREVSQRVLRAFQHADTAAFDRYRHLYWNKERFNWGRSGPALKDLDFAPSLGASHAKHDDLLQIADIIVGTVREFCAYNVQVDSRGRMPSKSYQDTNFDHIAPLFHRFKKRTNRYGFAIWPPSPPTDQLAEWVDSLCDEGIADYEGCPPR